jgi:hypothetical protein
MTAPLTPGPSLVAPGIYIGGATDVKPFMLEKYGIKSVLNCAKEMDNLASATIYLKLNLTDGDTQGFWTALHQGVAFIRANTGPTAKGSILVHCGQGISRSTTLVMAYLIKYQKMTPLNALMQIQAVRPFSGPAPEFLERLTTYHALQNHNCMSNPND